MRDRMVSSASVRGFRSALRKLRNSLVVDEAE